MIQKHTVLPLRVPEVVMDVVIVGPASLYTVAFDVPPGAMALTVRKRYSIHLSCIEFLYNSLPSLLEPLQQTQHSCSGL
jgi:hypothetical protein